VKRALTVLAAVWVAAIVAFALARCSSEPDRDTRACQLVKAELAGSNPDSVHLMGYKAVATDPDLREAITLFISSRGMAGVPGRQQQGYGGMATAAAQVTRVCAIHGVQFAGGNWGGDAG
jgi:hypothetical protein